MLMSLRDEQFGLCPFVPGAARLRRGFLRVYFPVFTCVILFLLHVLQERCRSRLNHGGESRFAAGRIPLNP